jgi:hypothetical protein
MLPNTDVSALAALGILESLMLALNDLKILPEAEIVGILQDAAFAQAKATTGDMEMHKAVAALIIAILDGGNSVRRPNA